MKDNKKVYSQPQTTLLYMENQEMICSSVQPKQNGSIQTDNGYNNGTYVNINKNDVEHLLFFITRFINIINDKALKKFDKQLSDVSDKYGLKVIYDAAHAFGVEVNGKSILEAGDISTLSFHATKVYNTIEGGALVCHDEKTKQRIDYLKNFGFADEITVIGPGINGKMDEIRSAYGLINLKQVDSAIAARQKVANIYRNALRDVTGISFMDDMPGVRHNYSYFPIFIDKEKYGMTRDELYFKMKDQGVWGRRYFYPLISEFSTYRGLRSSRPENLPNAHMMADTVICLPMHHALSDLDVTRIIKTLTKQ